MLKKIFLPLSLAVFHIGTGQNCTQELEPILPEGTHIFQEIHFKHRGNESPRILPRGLSYEDHDGNIKSVVPMDVHNVMINNKFNDKKNAGVTDMVIRSTGIHYKVVFKGNVVEFIPEENKGLVPFAINCNTKTLIMGDREIALKKEKVAVEHPDNIFKSQWEGYLWKPAKKDLNKISSYNFTIAKIRNSGKTYIEIKTPDDLHYRLLSS